VASNGDAFVFIFLVGGITVSPLPLEEFGLKNPSSPNGVCGTYGCHFPPWRTRCGNLLPHFLLQSLLLVASQGGFGGYRFGGCVGFALFLWWSCCLLCECTIFLFLSFVCTWLLLYSYMPNMLLSMAFRGKKATIFNDKLQYEEQSGYFKFI
jgi:hypothetical protein